jgi:hypothetical protein
MSFEGRVQPTLLRALERMRGTTSRCSRSIPMQVPALDQFLEALELERPSLLPEQPGLGTAVRLKAMGSNDSADAAFACRACGTRQAAGRQTMARRPFWLLYFEAVCG